MPTTQHDLHEVINLLNTKISELEGKRSLVADTPKNRATLSDMNARLTAAQEARTLLYDSCCSSQSCNFEWEEFASS